MLKSELREEGVPVVYIRDIRNGYYERKSKVCVTRLKAQSLPNCQVEPGDLLIAKVGDPPGIAAIYPDGNEAAIITQDVIRIRLNREIVVPEFLQFWFNSSLGKFSLKPIIVEGTRKRFGLGDLKKTTIKFQIQRIRKNLVE